MRAEKKVVEDGASLGPDKRVGGWVDIVGGSVGGQTLIPWLVSYLSTIFPNFLVSLVRRRLFFFNIIAEKKQ